MARSGSRTVAVQRRSVEREKAILDAAEALLGEQGYAAATLKAIGERAGIPTPSLYHYFRDRGQVEAELVRRYSRELGDRIAVALKDCDPATIRDAVDAVIDTVLAYSRETPSFLQLWTGNTGALLGMAREFDEEQAAKFRDMLIERNLMHAGTPLFALRYAFEVGDRLFNVAFQLAPGGDDATIDEARRLIAAYLRTYGPKPPAS